MNRRGFFKIFSWILISPIAILSYLGLKKEKKNKRNTEVFIPKEIIKKQDVYQGILIANIEDNVTFYSNKCSHLGCEITQKDDEKFLCSCHGSQFNIHGQPINGPAVNPLRKLNYQFITEKNGYLVFDKT